MSEHTYPSSYGRGGDADIDRAWDILDCLPVGQLPPELRAFLGGAIAGAIKRARQEGKDQAADQRAEDQRAGPTGEFPRGKISPDDEGELNIEMGFAGDTFIIRFGKKLSWIGMSREEAFQFAKLIMSKVVDRHISLDIPDR